MERGMDKVLRIEVLEEAARLTSEDRAKTYGPPTVNMECYAAFLELYRSFSGQRIGQSTSPAHDAAMAMVLAKIARIAVGVRGHRDNYTDAAAYLAIAYEADQWAL